MCMRLSSILRQCLSTARDSLTEETAEDLLFNTYKNKALRVVFDQEDLSKSLTDVANLVSEKTALDHIITPRHAYSLPNMAWRFADNKEKAKKSKFHTVRKMWSGLKTLFGKSSSKSVTFSHMKAAMGDINSNIDLSGSADAKINSTISCHRFNEPGYFVYLDLTEAEAYSICYGPGSPYCKE